MRRTLAPIAVLVAAVALGAAALTGGTQIAPQLLPEPTRPAATITTSAQALVDAGLASVDADGGVRVDAAATRSLLEQLPASDLGVAGYDRDAFGQRWKDIDRNGCDTRNDVLRQDLVDVTLKPCTNGCVVLSGTLHDPYTGTSIDFVRGQGTSELVQIDHIWPLALSWDHGAAGWSIEQRETFANDPLNLQAVDGSANASKSASGPGSWLPENSAVHCEYVARFTLIAAEYSLTVGSLDRTTIATVLDSCR